MPDVTISNRLNCAYHAAIAHALAPKGKLLADAKSAIDAWSHNNPYPPAFVDEWRVLLDAPVPALRRTIARRDSVGERLRGTSPFALSPSVVWSRARVERLWRFVAYHAMRVLEHFEYPLYAEHLKKLSRQDRMARFSAIVDDDWIEHFVEALGGDFSTIILGHFDPSLDLDVAARRLVRGRSRRYAVDRRGVGARSARRIHR